MPEPALRGVQQQLAGLPRRRSRAGEAGALRQAAVLVPLFESSANGLEVLLIKRPHTMSSHAGQVACPGGKLEPGETSLEAALRETEEELGIARGEVAPLGALHDVEVRVTRFVMTPWVGRIPGPDALTLRPDPGEVERVFQVPLDLLADRQASRFELRHWERDGAKYEVPYWRVEGETVWGATGRVLLDLIRLLYPERGF